MMIEIEKSLKEFLKFWWKFLFNNLSLRIVDEVYREEIEKYALMHKI